MRERKGEDKVDHKPEKGKSLFQSAADPKNKQTTTTTTTTKNCLCEERSLLQFGERQSI